MNNCILIGRLTVDPQLKYIPGSGTPVATFSLAVNRPFAKEGQVQADFFNIVVWNKIAENCANYLSKGSQVGIQGRLQNDNFEKDGQKRTITKVVAERVEFLSKKKDDNDSGTRFEPGGLSPDEFQALDNDDIPF